MYLQANKEYEKAAIRECIISDKAQKTMAGNARFLCFSPLSRMCSSGLQTTYTWVFKRPRPSVISPAFSFCRIKKKNPTTQNKTSNPNKQTPKNPPNHIVFQKHYTIWWSLLKYSCCNLYLHDRLRLLVRWNFTTHDKTKPLFVHVLEQLY